MSNPKGASRGNVLPSPRRRIATQSRSSRANDRIRPEDLEVVGSKVVRKSNKVTRSFYENLNGLNNSWKVRRLSALRNKLNLDLICGTEPNRKQSSSSARSLAENIFCNTPYIQTVSSFNHHETSVLDKGAAR